MAGEAASKARTDRRHPGDRAADQRRDFQRDRDRLLYSSAFRRLAGVTQVVHVAEGHVFHNRLTHTLKVGQIARRLAEYLLDKDSALVPAVGGLDPDVAETAALAHDLGHPPFGHIAEEELDDALVAKGVSDGYEGNAQSFRIVTKVAIRLEKQTGLNLTRASLNAILKYPWSRGVDGKEHDKWNYYFSEKEDFEFARELGPAGKQKSAEAELMDWADDVAYSVHDVDDFYRAGLVPLDRLLSGSEERERFIEAVIDRGKLKPEEHSWASDFFERQLKDYAPLDLRVPFTGTRGQRAALNFLSALLIRRYVVGGEEERAIQLNAGTAGSPVRIAPTLRREVDLLKQLMDHYVFRSPALVAQQFGQRQVVRKLFEVLFEAVQPNSENRGIIPPPYREAVTAIDNAADVQTDKRERARVVSDLIASLTEQQALSLHARVTGVSPGSILDVIVR